jgi:hypothetical protein
MDDNMTIMSTIIDAEEIINSLNFTQRLQLLSRYVEASPHVSRKFDDFLKKLAESDPLLLLKFEDSLKKEKKVSSYFLLGFLYLVLMRVWYR